MYFQQLQRYIKKYKAHKNSTISAKEKKKTTQTTVKLNAKKVRTIHILRCLPGFSMFSFTPPAHHTRHLRNHHRFQALVALIAIILPSPIRYSSFSLFPSHSLLDSIVEN